MKMCPSVGTVVLQGALASTAGEKESLSRAWEEGGGYGNSQIQTSAYRENRSGAQSWVMGREGCLGQNEK